MAGDRRTGDGFLVIADISGYTAFLTGSELLHAQAIIEELTRIILAQLGRPLELVKLEGDAVFCFARVEALADCERLLDQVERCYFEFAAHLEDSKRSTICSCTACSRMQTLDLKFFVHYGQFVFQHLGGRLDLAGPDVILVHRLLKNGVAERLHTRAYALLTAAALGRTQRPLAKLTSHTESYEHIGEVPGAVHDLRGAYEAMKSARREYLSAEEADFRLEMEFAVPPPVLWDYLIDPAKRMKWEKGIDGVTCLPNESGRVGTGAAFECAHGSDVMLIRLLDVRPFRYFTQRAGWVGKKWKMPPPFLNTVELEPLPGGGTRLRDRARWVSRNPLFLAFMRILAPVMRRELLSMYARLEAHLPREAVPVAGVASAAHAASA